MSGVPKREADELTMRGSDVTMDSENDKSHNDMRNVPFSTFSVFTMSVTWRMEDKVLGRPLLVKREMAGQDDGRGGSGQHAGVVRVHVLHAGRHVRTYAALVNGVVESRLLRHVVVRRRRRRHSDRLPLQPAAGARGANLVTGFTTASTLPLIVLDLVKYSLCKVDVNPQDDHQDHCCGNNNCQGNVGSLHGVVHVYGCNEGTKAKRGRRDDQRKAEKSTCCVKICEWLKSVSSDHSASLPNTSYFKHINV